MLSKNEFIALYEKSLRGECTPREQELLRSYKDDFEWVDGQWDDALQQESVYARLQDSISREEKVKRLFPWKKLAAAAAVLLAAGAAFFLLRPHQRNAPLADKTVAVDSVQQHIVPGSNKAVLILGDGSEIALGDAGSGQIARQGGALVQKTADGQIIYSGDGEVPAEPVFHTIAIPRGGQYDLTLPDGTRIWLNAASRLRFPAVFDGPERTVELDGEAYFEVARNERQPFRVKARGLEVDVLGTHFNVMAYADEPAIQTTLLEGKVRLSGGGAAVVLKPGQQGRFTEGQRIQVRSADLEQAMAWKNGMFVFNDEPLPSIMRKISRWYDVDVRFRDPGTTISFAGSISRFKNVQDVLHMLSLTGTVQFRVEGNTIQVMN
ncbi:FecR family protein [Chitinophaga rhizosphaerae]|uniref:FecR family protein n=1 Tax=Chitinophaga rhizosphaerae TaxID=1864947 RepID=UPI000F80C23E|nr:FecR family protein [Chitinophaga rhizosphaerae]